MTAEALQATPEGVSFLRDARSLFPFFETLLNVGGEVSVHVYKETQDWLLHTWSNTFKIKRGELDPSVTPYKVGTQISLVQIIGENHVCVLNIEGSQLSLIEREGEDSRKPLKSKSAKLSFGSGFGKVEIEETTRSKEGAVISTNTNGRERSFTF